MTMRLCYNCARRFDVETDDYERCVSCDKEYCEVCAMECATQWYEDNSTIPWILSCRWCNETLTFLHSSVN